MTRAVPQEYQVGDKLTGKEEWVTAGLHGEDIWTHRWGDGNDWWWPIVFVTLDVGLITIDVCGMPENWDLGDCSEVRIGLGKIIQNDNFYNQPQAAV